jgi:hypothetical protein
LKWLDTNLVPRINCDNVSVLNLGQCIFLNHGSCNDDPFANIRIDFLAEFFFSLKSIVDSVCSMHAIGSAYILLWEIDTGIADLHFQPPNGIPHRDRQRPEGNEIGNLMGEVGREVSREHCIGRRNIVSNNLQIKSTRRTLHPSG